MSTASASFNLKAAEFVPKGKIVKTEEQFPSLDMAADIKVAPKKVVQTQQATTT